MKHWREALILLIAAVLLLFSYTHKSTAPSALQGPSALSSSSPLIPENALPSEPKTVRSALTLEEGQKPSLASPGAKVLPEKIDALDYFLPSAELSSAEHATSMKLIDPWIWGGEQPGMALVSRGKTRPGFSLLTWDEDLIYLRYTVTKNSVERLDTGEQISEDRGQTFFSPVPQGHGLVLTRRKLTTDLYGKPIYVPFAQDTFVRRQGKVAEDASVGVAHQKAYVWTELTSGEWEDPISKRKIDHTLRVNLQVDECAIVQYVFGYKLGLLQTADLRNVSLEKCVKLKNGFKKLTAKNRFGFNIVGPDGKGASLKPHINAFRNGQIEAWVVKSRVTERERAEEVGSLQTPGFALIPEQIDVRTLAYRRTGMSLMDLKELKNSFLRCHKAEDLASFAKQTTKANLVEGISPDIFCGKPLH